MIGKVADMVDLRKLVITKKLYRFEVKKRYQEIKRFRVKQKTMSEKIIEDISSIFKSKKKEQKKPVGASPLAPKPEQHGAFNKTIILGTVLIAILLVVGGWFYLSNLISSIAEEPIVVPVSASVNSNVLDSGIISAGELKNSEFISYARINYNLKGLDNYSIRLSVYKEQLPQEVFMLSSYRDQADSYSEFFTELDRNLSTRGIHLNTIDFEDLETLPGNAIILLPTGRIPQQLLGVKSNINLVQLLDRGVVFVYIGQPFNRMINDDGLVILTPQQALQKVPISFVESGNIQTTDDFNLFQPLYTARSGGGGQIDSFQVYGSVSVLRKGSGAIVFLPQTLDGGWRDAAGNRDPRLAARDIARIIYETPWATKDGSSKDYFVPIPDNTTNIVSDYFSNTFKQSGSRSLKIEFVGNGETALKERYQILHVDRKNKGDLFVEGGYVAVPNEISLQQTRMNAILRGDSPEERFLFLLTTRDGVEVGDKFPIGRGPVNIQSEIPLDIPLHLDSGEYILSVIDDESRPYASTYLKVVFIQPNFVGQPKKGLYTFSIDRDSRPYVIREVEVTVDGGKNGVYKFTNTDTVNIDVTNSTGGDNLPPGKHAFDFKVGTITKTYNLSIPQSSGGIFTNPFFIGTLILSAIIIGIGVYFSRKDEISFQIDIPDFPPVTKTKIPLTVDTVLSVFEKINQDYKWAYTPLTTYEIKNGFRGIHYKGNPVYITDYNVEYVLEQLVGKGLVKESMGYYGLKSWIEKSKKSMDYLSMFRKIRDICVNNAVPFTLMGESQDCDSIITAVGQDIYTHIYDHNGDMNTMVRNSLKSVGKGITIILFAKAARKAEFEQLLYSTSFAMLTLKLEFDSGSVLLITTEEFEKMLKELKMV